MTPNQFKALSKGDVISPTNFSGLRSGTIVEQSKWGFYLKMANGDVECVSNEEAKFGEKLTRCRILWRGYHSVVAQCFVMNEWQKPHEYDTYDFRDEFEQNENVIITKVEA